ncbi:DnaJ domain-containing protein, partial [Glaesserella parasuis]|uniref:DnaJ domain-containing protein n=1 Tax=Glaesserella parasuis TaxID=738 RepID=UPI003B982826
MEFKDYYSALGIERTASDDEVRKAYRKLARKYHPDVSKEPDAEQRMRDINEAKDVLGDKEKRAAYDALPERDKTELEGLSAEHYAL